MIHRNTVVRSLHDIGLAAWFGGSLMGAVGLNGAAAKAKSPAERLRLSSIGWARWAPVQLAALAAHGIGGLGLIKGNKMRLIGQEESRTNTTIKTGVTLVALATTAYSGILGKRISDHQGEPTEGVTEPAEESSDALASAQRQQRIFQWLTPALTLVLIVLAAQQGEQQRPIKGLFQTTLKSLRK
ncbi:hypothetical protein RCH23_001677 [Cryobacterium sp. CAN_C3]|uniref:hypothetical protein n=1 Tax=unclassified Cryobacterium TaxID=2649013 RepID=UPI0018CA52A1|nr:hypothetical protein [Cryobacterium sp. CAN_C3]MEC5154297.1 hypothetical protein [Cryobacterium sp. CAN_C3]